MDLSREREYDENDVRRCNANNCRILDTWISLGKANHFHKFEIDDFWPSWMATERSSSIEEIVRRHSVALITSLPVPDDQLITA